MEISSENNKILVNSTKPRPLANIQMNGQTLGEAGQFKYLGSTQNTDGISRNGWTSRCHHCYTLRTSLGVGWRKTASLSWWGEWVFALRHIDSQRPLAPGIGNKKSPHFVGLGPPTCLLIFGPVNFNANQLNILHLPLLWLNKKPTIRWD